MLGRLAVMSVGGFLVISVIAHALAFVGLSAVPSLKAKRAPIEIELIKKPEDPRLAPRAPHQIEAPPGAGKENEKWKFGRMDEAKDAPTPSNGEQPEGTRPAKSDTQAEEIAKSPENATRAVDAPAGKGGTTALTPGPGALSRSVDGVGQGVASLNGSPGGDEGGEGAAAGGYGSAKGGSPSLYGAAGGGLIPVSGNSASSVTFGSGIGAEGLVGSQSPPRAIDAINLQPPTPTPAKPTDDTCMQCPTNACTNVLTDPLNCGRCGNVCKTGQSCLGAYCCGGDGEQYVVDFIQLPASPGQFAIDLDGDGVPDNQFFQFIKAVGGLGQSLQNDLNGIIYSGEEIILWEVPSKADPSKPYTLLQGMAQPKPIFSGGGTFTADAAMKSSQFVGVRNGDVFEFHAKPDQNPPMLNLVIRSPDQRLTFVIPFQCHHLSMEVVDKGIIQGSLHGSFKRADLVSDQGFLGQTSNFLAGEIDPSNHTVSQNTKTTLLNIFDRSWSCVPNGNTCDPWCVNPDGKTRGYPEDDKISPCEIVQSPAFGYEAAPGVHRSVFDPDLLVWTKTGQFEPRHNPTPNDPKTPNDSFSFGLTFTTKTAKIKNCGVDPVDGGTHD